MSQRPRPIAESALDPRTALSGRTLEIHWTGMPARVDNADPAHHAYTIALSIMDARHGMLEAWGGPGERPLVERLPVSCVVAFDGDLLHVDARHDDQTLLAVTLRGDDELLYVRTPILLDAGVAPGACDPPRGQLRAPQRGAATA